MKTKRKNMSRPVGDYIDRVYVKKEMILCKGGLKYQKTMDECIEEFKKWDARFEGMRKGEKFNHAGI